MLTRMCFSFFFFFLVPSHTAILKPTRRESNQLRELRGEILDKRKIFENFSHTLTRTFAALQPLQRTTCRRDNDQSTTIMYLDQYRGGKESITRVCVRFRIVLGHSIVIKLKSGEFVLEIPSRIKFGIQNLDDLHSDQGERGGFAMDIHCVALCTCYNKGRGSCI